MDEGPKAQRLIRVTQSAPGTPGTRAQSPDSSGQRSPWGLAGLAGHCSLSDRLGPRGVTRIVLTEGKIFHSSSTACFTPTVGLALCQMLGIQW